MRACTVRFFIVVRRGVLGLPTPAHIRGLYSGEIRIKDQNGMPSVLEISLVGDWEDLACLARRIASGLVGSGQVTD